MKRIIAISAILFASGCNDSHVAFLTFDRDICWHEGGKFSYKWGVVKENFLGKWYGYITHCAKDEK